METTVDPTLLQIARIIHATAIKGEQVAMHDFTEIGLPAALHALKGMKMARVECFNEGELEHWEFTSFGFSQLEVDQLTREVAIMVISPMGQFLSKVSIVRTTTDLALLDAYERIIPETIGLWRGIGLVMIALAGKCMVFQGHEERGAWIFRITKRGEKMGLGKRNELFYYSATGELPHENMEVVWATEFSQRESRAAMKLN